MTIQFERAIPIFRIFSLDKAREFYVDFLGCKVDWEASFEPDLPVYMQVSRGALVVHLSEHHGDGTPGTHVIVRVNGIDALLAELRTKNYRFFNPAIQDQEWGTREMVIYDPFGNHLVFSELMVPAA